ncbi:hypothetical protein [Endozoicomonas sp. SCSIO W0465]|uniref:hypothetical protein n=1 Tax=Endozoicomonas sp. SCSIO W0465 TaxID=2918516 RepID=UPI0020759A06|nr:hypothetical protein [Endozoicomonas sp. SCSIO W0465]USE36556.1 hypothetical protein MJO57_31870 [Endozoicomonas sp. SCSIO W0465]
MSAATRQIYSLVALSVWVTTDILDNLVGVHWSKALARHPTFSTWNALPNGLTAHSSWQEALINGNVCAANRHCP